MRLQQEWPAWLAAGVVVSMVALLATTAFDLASVATVATELRARAALGGGLNAIIGPLCVLLVPAIGACWCVWCVAGLGRSEDHEHDHDEATRPSVLLPVLVLVTVALPLLMLVLISLETKRAGPLDDGLVAAAVGALGRSAIIGVLSAALVPAIMALLRDRRLRPSTHRWLGALAMVWICVALLPAALVAGAWAQLQQWLGPGVAEAGLGRMAALLLPGTAIAFIVSRLHVERMSMDAVHLQAMDGVPWWRPCRRTQRAMVMVACIGAAWSLFVPAVESRLAPPASGPPLVTRLVDAMHYQRPETVVLALWLIVALAVAAGIVLVLAMRGLPRRGAAMLLLLVLVVGCSPTADATGASPQPLEAHRIIGGPGTAPGRFVTPRAIDAGSGILVVVDRSGRLQRINVTTGDVIEVDLPLEGLGYPTGVRLLADGRALVADTHGGRVLEVSVGGTVSVLAGTGLPSTAQFINPTDVLVGPDNLLYVSEYGGLDRIQVLRWDGTLVRTLGAQGEGQGQFRRPQAMDFDADGHLWVADACNHRLQLLDRETGHVIRTIGPDTPLRYPYGIRVLENGDLLVSEYGGNVLRRLSSDGTRWRTWGGWGDAPGRLRTPWSLAIDDTASMAYLADTGHNRVIAIDLESLSW
jgi:DNA-binding beta-propeller fold protein YncE